MREVKIGRREFVQGSLVASVLPIGSWASGKEPQKSLGKFGTAKLHRLLVDRTIPESVRLGSYANSIAEEVFVFDGDLTKLWNDELRLQWPNGPRPIAGLTTPAVRLVLEQFGRDHDARIVFSAEHRKVAGRTRHSLAGCESIFRSPKLRGGSDWVADMARHIAVCPHEPARQAAALEYETALAPGAADNRQPLVTWVLARVSRLDSPHNLETVS